MGYPDTPVFKRELESQIGNSYTDTYVKTLYSYSFWSVKYEVMKKCKKMTSHGNFQNLCGNYVLVLREIHKRNFEKNRQKETFEIFLLRLITCTNNHAH